MKDDDDIQYSYADLQAAVLAEREACAKHYLGIMRDAVEQAVLREREACAKVADNIAKEMYRHGEGPTGYILFVEECAAAIRARDMSTKPQNIDTSAEHVHEIDKSIHEPMAILKVWDEKEQKHVLINYYLTPPNKQEEK